jgi:hypothetical protein
MLACQYNNYLTIIVELKSLKLGLLSPVHDIRFNYYGWCIYE